MALQFWKDRSKDELNPELFSKVAEQSAKLVADRSNQTTNNPTQLRRFFDEIVSFDSKYKLVASKASSEEERKTVFKQQLPFIHMLIPKVRYAQARKLVTEDFTNLIEEAVKEVKEPKDIKVFTSFFEAFIGHFKYFKETSKDNNRGGRN